VCNLVLIYNLNLLTTKLVNFKWYFIPIVLVFITANFALAQNACKVYFNQLPFTVTNQGFNFTDTDCDPCIFGGSITAANTYCCRKSCIKASVDCRKKCSTLSGLPSIAACVDGCNQQNNSCLLRCGAEPTKVKEPVAYGYGVQVWISSGPLAPPTNLPPNYQFNTGQFALEGVPPTNISMLWPTQIKPIGKAYCIFAYLRVFYGDGSCCDFYTFKCESIG
jgi:hypothetical protein